MRTSVCIDICSSFSPTPPLHRSAGLFSLLVPTLSPLWVLVWLREPKGFDWSWGPSQRVGSLLMFKPDVLDEITRCDRAQDTTNCEWR